MQVRVAVRRQSAQVGHPVMRVPRQVGVANGTYGDKMRIQK